jgi:hypothetical protein
MEVLMKRGFGAAIRAKIGTHSLDVVYVRPTQSLEPGARFKWVERQSGETYPIPSAPIQTGVVDSVNEHGEVRISRM